MDWLAPTAGIDHRRHPFRSPLADGQPHGSEGCPVVSINVTIALRIASGGPVRAWRTGSLYDWANGLQIAPGPALIGRTFDPLVASQPEEGGFGRITMSRAKTTSPLSAATTTERRADPILFLGQELARFHNGAVS